MKRRHTNTARKWTTQRLVRIALREWNRDRGWAAIHELRLRGSPGVLALAQSLASNSSGRRRALGLHLSAQLRQRRRDAKDGSVVYALEETQQLLLVGLRDARPEVLGAAISGLGHRPHPEALDGIVAQETHHKAEVRFDVAFALGSYQEPRAVAALLKLVRDADDDVRDWATFSLGTLHVVDTPEVREMLAANLQDPDLDVRGEALVGLAKRGDARAVEVLRSRADADRGHYEYAAVQALSDRGLLPAA